VAWVPYLERVSMVQACSGRLGGRGQGLLPVLDPRPSTRVLGRVQGTLKYPDTYSSNVEFSTLVPVTY
jgi:hypothetical protein